MFGLKDVVLIQIYVERRVVEVADWVFLEVLEEGVFEVARDILVVAIGCRGHVEVSFDELIARTVSGRIL